MILPNLAIHSSCIAFALLLFFIVNWIGKHAVSFGYSSTTLLEAPDESLALNFIVRTLPPAVLMVLLSALAVASSNEELRLQSYWIAVYYYAIRAAYFPLFGIHRLVNWRRFLVHASIGLAAAWVAYRYLILPKKSLFPDLETAGNELWLAMLVFVYAVGNNVFIADPRSASRRNSYVRHRYQTAVRDYGSIIDRRISNDLLRLIAYAIIVYEGYCRPPAIRTFERLWFWKSGRTTGVMQVSSDRPLTDSESVEMGAGILIAAWQDHQDEDTWQRVRSVVAEYNRDDDYVDKVLGVMEIIAKRVEPKFSAEYENIWDNRWVGAESKSVSRHSRIRSARFSQVQSPRRIKRMHQRRRE